MDIQHQVDQYAPVSLTADLSGLTDTQKRIVALLIRAAEPMDRLFWRQAYGEPVPLLRGSADEPALRRYLEINYGPWDRLAANEPFVAEVGPKPDGANFYPVDMTADEFREAAAAAPDGGEALRSLYTLVRRDDDGTLVVVPYHEAFADRLRKVADLLRHAADLAESRGSAGDGESAEEAGSAEDVGLSRYLRLRADALLSDDYRQSDRAWLDMKDNRIDVVIGPIETYEDQLFGYKASYEAYVLLKDMDWSRRLSRFVALLPSLQKALPVPDAYKQETPGTDSDLNAYHVLYYAGSANAGAKTIAINLPNDEEVQLEKGTRRLQLENAMRAKFDEILLPIAGVLVDPHQRAHVTFDAFFSNTMFHEVAHGLGVKHTIHGDGTVREALREHYSALEEGKADVLGLWLVGRLRDRGEITEGALLDNQVTFLASIFRSVRFGAADAHARANMARFHFFRERGAFVRDPDTGTYRVVPGKMRDATDALSERILRIQGDGDYQAAGRMLAVDGVVGDTLQADLNRLEEQDIPVDIVFRQGASVLEGLPGATP